MTIPVHILLVKPLFFAWAVVSPHGCWGKRVKISVYHTILWPVDWWSGWSIGWQINNVGPYTLPIWEAPCVNTKCKLATGIRTYQSPESHFWLAEQALEFANPLGSANEDGLTLWDNLNVIHKGSACSGICRCVCACPTCNWECDGCDFRMTNKGIITQKWANFWH